MPQYYTIPQVAKITGVTTATLTKWIKNGDLTHFIVWYVDEKGRSRLLMDEPCELDEPHDTIPYAYKWKGG